MHYGKTRMYSHKKINKKKNPATSLEWGNIIANNGAKFKEHSSFFRVWPHGDRRLYRLGIKVDYGGTDERYAMNKTNDHDSMIHAQL